MRSEKDTRGGVLDVTDVLERIKTALADRYAVERELGSGGMATVYLALDVKNERRVAIKVLRPELAAIVGAERFLNEIRVTANLQHPHILPLFDSGEAAGLLFYAMPYVEGESLRDKLERERQLSLDDTVRITQAVASALDFAHKREVIHRDIKPENILLQDGQPLVADFGIALAVTAAGGSRLTETGLSLGTPQYMSPEQAAGDRHVDYRSDIYALGCVAYEMLSGDPPHTGSTVQAIIAKAISEKPQSLRITRDSVTPGMDAAVRKALAKLPADRYTSAGAFGEALAAPGDTLALEGADAAGGLREAAQRRPVLALGLVAVVTSILALWGWLRPSDATPGLGVRRTTITIPEGRLLSIMDQSYPFALSPDGEHLAYVGRDSVGTRLFVRPLDAFEARALAGTEGARQPFFSPAGAWIGFFANGELQRVAVSGGAPLSIAPVAGLPFGGSWGAGDRVLYSESGTGLWLASVAGGEPPRLVLSANASSDDEDSAGAPASVSSLGTPRWPHILPDGRNALVTTDEGIGVVSLEDGSVRILLKGTQPRYIPTGHLVFGEAGERVRIAPFDLGRLEVTGPPVALLEDVFRGPGNSALSFAISDNGTMVYVSGGFERTLVEVDRTGRETPILDARRGYRFPKWSPDGKRIAVTVDPRPSDIWVVDVARRTAERLTGDEHDLLSVWSPDGERILFDGGGDMQLVSWRGGAAPVVFLSREGSQYPVSWSRDGRRVIFQESSPGKGLDLLIVDLEADTAIQPFLVSDAPEHSGQFSPDGNWIAYMRIDDGREDVYVRPYPGPGPRYRVSADGGRTPLWSADGRELYYWDGTRAMAVEIQTAPFAVGPAVPLFGGPYDFTQRPNWDVSPDGRFVMVKGDPATTSEFKVVFDWFEELELLGLDDE